MDVSDVIYRINPSVTNDELNALFAAAWLEHSWHDFHSILNRSLAFVCAYRAERLVGFVNLAWDGGIHTFILDTTVHPSVRRCGIGRQLVRQAVAVARVSGIVWLHVDFEPNLRDFYKQCGFQNTEAGLMRLEPSNRT